jgi:TonB family protein
MSLDSDSLGNIFLVKNNNSLPRILDKNEKIYSLADVMPEFPGGEHAFRNYIISSIQYPEDAVEEGIIGRVFVSFVVSKNGEVANAEVVRGVHESIDIEALRIINSLPSWKPGVKNGEIVNIRYTVPITFEMNFTQHHGQELMPMKNEEKHN